MHGSLYVLWQQLDLRQNKGLPGCSEQGDRHTALITISTLPTHPHQLAIDLHSDQGVSGVWVTAQQKQRSSVHAAAASAWLPPLVGFV